MSDAAIDKEPESGVEWANYWKEELQSARTPAIKRFHRRGEKIDERFRDDRKESDRDEVMGSLETRLNLFNSNITMLMCMMYGKTPKVEVSRRFDDADDDVARVAGLILTRILNTDIEVAGEDMVSVFRNALQDRLLPGLGTASVQYQCEEEEHTTPAIVATDPSGAQIELAPAVTQNVVTREWTDILYTHWKDELWSPARTHAEIWWKGRRSYLTRAGFKKRFPDVECRNIAFDSKGPLGTDNTSKGNRRPLVEVWEFWDKTRRQVFWWADGAPEILDQQDDPLELAGFFNSPPPMVANVTTSKYVPKADYDIAVDLYQAIDELETRITLLTDACKLVGLYDKSQESIKRLFNEGVENDLIPVDNWAMFAEKGGITGSIVFLPIKEVAEVIALLTEKQGQKIQQLQQITGMSDVMRGAASARTERVSATADKLETQFGSIRVEALQNDFARWVTDTQALKVEIIARHYQPECIKKQSNIMVSQENAAYADAAIALIKDPDSSQWKISVRPETLAIADYAQLKADRTDFLMGVAQFMQSAGPLLQLMPSALPFMMKLMKWFLSGFRASAEIEGIIDQAVSQIEKSPPKNDKPDPEAEKMKAEMQLKQQEHADKMKQSQAEFAAEMQLKQQAMQQEQQKFTLEIQQSREEHRLEMQKLKGELIAAAEEQRQQFLYNTAERNQEIAANQKHHEIDISAAKKKAEISSAE